MGDGHHNFNKDVREVLPGKMTLQPGAEGALSTARGLSQEKGKGQRACLGRRRRPGWPGPRVGQVNAGENESLGTRPHRVGAGSHDKVIRLF